MLRPLVSYDDISLLPEKEQKLPAGPHAPLRPPPSKRRKRSAQSPKDVRQHWDHDPDLPQTMSYDEEDPASAQACDDVAVNIEEEEEIHEQSRQLTHNEIWDDSALIDAWNAATEEYEAYHGTNQDWKTEVVNKSPLWYNVPPSSSKDKHHNIQPSHLPESNTSPNGKADDDASADENSYPVNFDTFFPSHDPSLGQFSLPHPAQVPESQAFGSLPDPQGPIVSQDEAFNRALGAMYWGGYWTAVYHCTKNRQATLGEDVKEDLVEK